MSISERTAEQATRFDKWGRLAPYLRQHGREALSYATLQEGMEYFVEEGLGYVAFTSVSHPVFARKGRQIVLSDPLCAREDLPRFFERFLERHPQAAFAVISEACAEVLRELKFKVNCIGYEPELPIQTYKTTGNWKELDLVKRARNEARREDISIAEVDIEQVDREQLQEVSKHWIGGKKVNDREIWIYARRPVFGMEPDVRKFVAYDRGGRVAGFAFYDPMYRDGRVVGYSANISRCDERRYGKLATAIHMHAMEIFRSEGKEVLNLCLAPFVKLDMGKYNDDLVTKWFFQFSEEFGNNIYNFKGLSFHKSKYRGQEKPLYFASSRRVPSNDVYLAFLMSDITRSYFATLGRLAWGMISTRSKKTR